jgi:hypothetical protein
MEKNIGIRDGRGDLEDANLRPATYDDIDPFGHEEGHQVCRI